MKIVTDYEVEGCWTNGKNPVHCRCCGAITEKLVLPEHQNHFNSRYLRLKRRDGCFLVVCPNGCAEKLAQRIVDGVE